MVLCESCVRAGGGPHRQSSQPDPPSPSAFTATTLPLTVSRTHVHKPGFSFWPAAAAAAATLSGSLLPDAHAAAVLLRKGCRLCRVAGAGGVTRVRFRKR